MQDGTPNIQDVLSAVSDFSTRMDHRFDRVEGRLDGVERRLDGVEGRLDGVEREVKDLRATMTTQYVSKSYLDQKMTEHTEAIISRIDRKLERESKFRLKIIEILGRHKLVSSDEYRELEQMI